MPEACAHAHVCWVLFCRTLRACARRGAYSSARRQWMDLKVPLKDFIPVVRGNTLRDAPRQINTANIYSVQVMLSKYEYDGTLAGTRLAAVCSVRCVLCALWRRCVLCALWPAAAVVA